MIPLNIILDGEGAFKDWGENYTEGNIVRFAMLEQGMVSGLPSVALGIELPDGKKIIAQTSWALLHNACRAAEARYGTPHLDQN